MLGEGDTFGINGSFDASGKKFSINFRIVWLSLNYDGDNSYLFVNEKEIFKHKVNNGNIYFPAWFYLGSISDGFHATESREGKCLWFGRKCLRFFSRLQYY